MKTSPHPDPDSIEATPLPLGEGPGVRGITRHFHLPVAPHRGMITRNDMSAWAFRYNTFLCQPWQAEDRVSHTAA